MNVAQLVSAYGGSSGLMSGPPAKLTVVYRTATEMVFHRASTNVQF
jgi:hypothetical protein